MTTHASALNVIHHKGQPIVSVSDLAGALTGMIDALGGHAHAKGLAAFRNMFDEMLAPQGKAFLETAEKRPAYTLSARACSTCNKPVVDVPAMGQDGPVTVEVYTDPNGKWVPVDRADGTVLLVPYGPQLDGVGGRVNTHACG